MANGPHKHGEAKLRGIPAEEVAAFDAAAAAAGSNRSAVTRQLWAWFAGGGELPQRPLVDPSKLRVTSVTEYAQGGKVISRKEINQEGEANSRKIEQELQATEEYEREAAQERRKWAAKRKAEGES